MLTSYAVLDFETTGLYAGQDRVIEVAAVIVENGTVAETFAELMDPGFAVPSFITGLTGITNAMLRGRPRPDVVMPRLQAFLGEEVCIAHNASFDQRFFTAEMALAGETHERAFLCSMLLSRRLVRDAPSHKLGSLVRHLHITPPAGMQAHRALADALMTVELWKRLEGMLAERLNGRRPDRELYRALMKKPKAAVEAFLATISGQAAYADASLPAQATTA